MRSRSVAIAALSVAAVACGERGYTGVDNAQAPPTQPPIVTEDASPADASVEADAPAGAPLLDDFNRADGDLGSSWIVSTGPDLGTWTIKGQAAQYNQGASGCGAATATWVQPFGASQEIAVTFKQTPGYGVIELRGKIDDSYSTWISMRFDVGNNVAQVNTPTADIGAPIPFVARVGDRVGARFHADGRVELVRNGVVVDTRLADQLPWIAREGRVGFEASCAGNGAGVVIDDVGGGTLPVP